MSGAKAPGTPVAGARFYPADPLGGSVEGVPTGRDVEWEPLIDYRRHGVSETTIHGAVAWASGDRVVHSFGGNVLCYGRSMMKPFTIRAVADVLGPITDRRQKAISVSSHNGTPEHVAAAQSLLAEGEWGLVQTPLDVPLVQFGRQVRRPRRWYHPCSGEHAAIVAACRHKGWPRVGYTLPHHPLFGAYLDVLRRFLGPEWSPVRVARDGCGLPTVSNTVGELAICFAGFSRTRNDDWIWDAMVSEPDLVGGFDRLDSTILKAGGGRVVAKEGADGLLGLAIVHDAFPEGLGVVIKIAHGWDPHATWYVARAILGVLGVDLRNPYPLHRQKAFLVPGMVPPEFLDRLRALPTWDAWDPDKDKYDYDWSAFGGGGLP